MLFLLASPADYAARCELIRLANYLGLAFGHTQAARNHVYANPEEYLIRASNAFSPLPNLLVDR